MSMEQEEVEESDGSIKENIFFILLLEKQGALFLILLFLNEIK